MTDSQRFLNRTPDELEDFLLGLARHDRAPAAARARALSRVTALSAMAGVAASTKTSLAAGVGQAGSSWLAAKWFAIGLISALGTLTAVDQVQRSGSATPASPPQPVPLGSAQQQAPQAPGPVGPMVSAEPSAAAPHPALPAALPAPSRDVELDGATTHEASGSFEAPRMEQLSREVAVLKQARSALASGDVTQAQLALNRYRSEFPVGVLAMEAAALQIETAFALGDRERGAALAAAFLRDHATSPLAARVRAVADADNKP